jgi:hypothetical protein
VAAFQNESEPQDISENCYESINEISKYDINGYKGVIPGVAVSTSLLPPLKNMQNAWKRDDYRIEKISGETLDIRDFNISIIRKMWVEGYNQLEFTMMVFPSYHKAISHITDFAKALSNARSIGQTDAELGQEFGNACIIFRDLKSGYYSSISFIRRNVVILMQAEGNVIPHLSKMARKVDDKLKKTKPICRYSQLKKTLDVTILCHAGQIELGTRTPIELLIDDKNSKNHHCIWKMKGGGIERDRDGNLFYYGGELGENKITVFVINDLGIFQTQQFMINVVESKMDKKR